MPGSDAGLVVEVKKFLDFREMEKVKIAVDGEVEVTQTPGMISEMERVAKRHPANREEREAAEAEVT